jgi:hypothetical protein
LQYSTVASFAQQQGAFVHLLDEGAVTLVGALQGEMRGPPAPCTASASTAPVRMALISSWASSSW